jgi:hypothetical protein
MNGEISLGEKLAVGSPDREEGWLGLLEDRVDKLLIKYQEMMKERDGLAAALDSERERARQLEKVLESFTEDRERVKIRIDQLLHRLRGIDY